MKQLTCEHCGGPMRKTVISSGNCRGLLLALIMLLAGVAVIVFFAWTIIGLVIGALMMIAALFMGGTRQKVWKCRNCGYVFNRG